MIDVERFRRALWTWCNSQLNGCHLILFPLASAEPTRASLASRGGLGTHVHPAYDAASVRTPALGSPDGVVYYE